MRILILLLFFFLKIDEVATSKACKAAVPPIQEDEPEDSKKICLSSELNMVELKGVPDASSVSTDTLEGLAWDSCVKKCESSDYCMMASQKSGSDICTIYNYADVWKVTIGSEESADKISIKINKKSETCQSMNELFNKDTVFDQLHPISNFTTWQIIAVDTLLTFKYNDDELDYDGECNDFLMSQPSCSPEKCQSTMVTYNGKPFELRYNYHNDSRIVHSWRDCLAVCWKNPDCFMVSTTKENSTSCDVYLAGYVKYIERTNETSGARIGIKLGYNPTTCSQPKEASLSAAIFKSPPGMAVPKYRLNSDSKTIGVLFNASICPNGVYRINRTSGFVMYHLKSNMTFITYNESSRLCKLVGRGLYTFAHREAALDVQLPEKMMYECEIGRVWYGRQKGDHTSFVGLKRNPADLYNPKAWLWEIPEMVQDDSAYAWDVNAWGTVPFPDRDLTKNCGQINGFGSFRDYSKLQNIDCNAANGFLCYIPDYFD